MPPRGPQRQAMRAEEPDHRHRRLLRARRERPRCRAAEQRDELAPLQLSNCIRCPSQLGAAYRIGEDQVRGSLQCGISSRLCPLGVKSPHYRTATWESALTSNSGR